jgi:hypothetical protein
MNRRIVLAERLGLLEGRNFGKLVVCLDEAQGAIA